MNTGLTCSIIIKLGATESFKQNQSFFMDSFLHVKSIAKNLTDTTFIFSQNKNDVNDHTLFFESTKDLINHLIVLGDSFDHFIIFHATTPLLDKELSDHIKKAHLDSLADYTFYDQYPQGLAPFALYKEALIQIKESLLTEEIYTPSLLESILKKDLNSYDIEVLLAPDDFRFLKDSFFLDNIRMVDIIKSLKPFFKEAKNLHSFLKAHGDLFVGAPSFVEISLTNRRSHTPIFVVPTTEKETHLDIVQLNHFIKIISQLNPQVIIQFTLIEGEPFSHPKIDQILELIHSFSSIKFIIETEGSLIKPFINKIASLKNLKIMIYINASHRELYSQIHGIDHFDQVEEALDLLLIQNNENTYLQIIRMTDNEEDLLHFFNRWKNFSSQIIVSQYDYLNGQLSHRKVVDLTPIKRFPCFKLQRELFLNCYGKFQSCVKDPQYEIPFFDERSVHDAINQRKLLYKEQCNENYENPCQRSDHWYIFNA